METTGSCSSLYRGKSSPFGFLNIHTGVNMERVGPFGWGWKVLWVFFSIVQMIPWVINLIPELGKWKLRLVLLVGNFGPVWFGGLGEIAVLQVLSPPKSTNSSM